VLAASAAIVFARPALAADCSAATNPVYIAGSTAIRPALIALASKLAALTPPINIVYQKQGSCTGLSNFTGGTTLTGTGIVYDGTATPPACTFGTPTPIDIAGSDVFPSSCPNVTLVGTQKDFSGPVQAMTFVVPKNSTESSISDQAAYVVEGWGGVGQYTIAPWTIQSSIHVRGPGSGTQTMLGVAIGLVASKWAATGGDAGAGTTLEPDGPTLATNVGSDPNTNAAIGILATGDADQNRDKLKILAFQYTKGGQQCGYLPDSTSLSFDKINVRQGRYAVWGAFHAIANVDAGGNPVSANVATVLKYLTNDASLAAADSQAAIDATATAHVIPRCAMQVSRTEEVGAEASYQPDVPCGCYFESKVGTASASCKTCTNDSGCAAPNPKCRYGYCEAK
jgi:ABC-type phosphate transport system substrate-binding protein